MEAMDSGCIRVLLADGQRSARSEVRASLSTAPDIVIIAETTSDDHADRLVARLKPDVIVADCTSSSEDGIETVRRLAYATPDSAIVLVSGRPEEEWLILALDAGATGFVPARAVARELCSAVRGVARDQIVLPRSAGELLITHAHHQHAQIPVDGTKAGDLFARLTLREGTVFRLIAEGFSAPEVGRLLHISKKTVETYKKRIRGKLDISHRSDYVTFALCMGVLVSHPELPGAGETVTRIDAKRAATTHFGRNRLTLASGG